MSFRSHWLAATLATILLAPSFAEVPPPGSAPPGVEIQEDGTIIARPSGLKLPRRVLGPNYTHTAMVRQVDATTIKVDYGPITVTIGPVTPAADPVMLPPGTRTDPDPPDLPALLFWGESAAPVTYSFPSDGSGAGKDWLSFVVIAQNWQIELSSHYSQDDRDLIVRTAEAVWATLASANETAPR